MLSLADSLPSPSRSTRLRALWLAVLVLLLPFAVLFWLSPGGSHTIGNDYGLFSLHNQMELQFSMQHGSFPLYVHGFAGGRSSAALTLGQAFHPLAHLAAHSPGYWVGRALDCNTFWRLVSLGVTHLVLLRVLRGLGLRLDLAFVASFLTVYNLRMLDMFRYGASLENYTGLLLLCAAMVDGYVRRRPVSGPLGVVAATYLLVCGGHPQMAYLGFISVAIVMLAIPFVVPALRAAPPPPARAALSFYARTSACIATGVLLASAYLLPLYVELVRDAPHRTTRAYEWSTEFSDSLRGALNSFFAPLHADVHGAFGSSVLATLAVAAPFALAPARGVPGRGVAAALAGTVAVLFLCSVGGDSPIHHLFWAHVPLANTFRVPGRLAVVQPALLALLLAWTFARLDGAAAACERPLFSPPLLVAQVALAFGLWHLLPDRLTDSSAGFAAGQIQPLPGWLDPVVFALGAVTLGLAAIRFSRWRRRELVGPVLAAVVVLQGALQLRHGTWVSPRVATPTLAEMRASRAEDLKFRDSPESDMQPAIELIDGGRPEGFLRIDRTQAASGDPGDRVATTHAAFNRLVFMAETGGTGDLVVAIPFARQWHARVDGRGATVSPSPWNELQVPVPAGRHQIELRFESPASVAGMGLSCLTFAAIGLFAARALDRRAARVVASAFVIAFAATTFVAWRGSLYGGRDLGTRYSWPSSSHASSTHAPACAAHHDRLC